MRQLQGLFQPWHRRGQLTSLLQGPTEIEQHIGVIRMVSQVKLQEPHVAIVLFKMARGRLVASVMNHHVARQHRASQSTNAQQDLLVNPVLPADGCVPAEQATLVEDGRRAGSRVRQVPALHGVCRLSLERQWRDQAVATSVSESGSD